MKRRSGRLDRPANPAGGYGDQIKRFLGTIVLKAFRTHVVGDVPDDPACVWVCAPHTSNWDFILMLAIAWTSDIDPIWLGKKEMFRGPFAPLFRRMGGMAIDRDKPEGIVDEIVKAAKTRDAMAIVIPPEASRTRKTYWKSGFRRIAVAADLPIVLAFVGGPDNTCGIGPRLTLTDDVVADMDILREFYADKGGLKPKLFTPPLLREEEEYLADLADEQPRDGGSSGQQSER